MPLTEEVEEFKKYFDEKLEAMFNRAREVMAKRSANLKNQGNQEQFDHQLDLLERAERIEELVKAGRKEAALEKLSGLKEAIEERMMLIKIADSSAHGWHTVAEYKSNDLATSSADERRITKAEARAEAKRKNVFAERNVKRARFDPSTSRDETAASRHQFFRAQRVPTNRNICFGCGDVGHWKAACPQLRGSYRGGPGAKGGEEPKTEQ